MIVILKNKTIDDAIMYEYWCNENHIEVTWRIRWASENRNIIQDGIQFSFANDEDAVKFKLTFG